MKDLATVCCKVLLALCVGLGLPSLAVACGGDDGEAPSEVVLVTHDSFAISDDVKAAFERESGLTLRILQSGDASEMLTKALLTRATRRVTCSSGSTTTCSPGHSRATSSTRTSRQARRRVTSGTSSTRTA